MATNDFLPFANGVSANVLPQASYAALTTLLANGYQTGVAPSNQMNKTWRQSSIIATAVAQYIADLTGQNVVDDGTTATILANLKTAVSLNSKSLFTTTGTSTAYIGTPTTAITSYAAGQIFDVTFHVASGASPTLQISGIASPPSLVKQRADGSYVNITANDVPANWTSPVKLVSATQALIRNLPTGLRSASLGSFTTTTTLTAAHLGQSFIVSNVTPFTLTLPAISAAYSGARIAFTNVQGAAVTISAAGADGIYLGVTIVTSIVLLGGDTLELENRGDYWFSVGGSAQLLYSATFAANSAQIYSINSSVASNALTISAGQLSLDFRSATLGSGTVTRVTGTPANLVISSGSTMGTASAVQSRLVVLALNNGGTIELAAVNIAGGNQLDETNLISTTAEGGAGAADSVNVIYSTTARASVPYRVIGYIDITETTAGTWATAPTVVQGVGGQALASLSSLGYGQTWQSVVRTSGTTYYNTTGKPICFAAYTTASATYVEAGLSVNGIAAFSHVASASAAGFRGTVQGIIPPGAWYVFNIVAGSWAVAELR